MTINTNIHGLTIEIKAKGLHGDRFNKRDTFAFLNALSIYASEAAQLYSQEGSTPLAKEAREFSDLLYYMMKETGYYDRDK